MAEQSKDVVKKHKILDDISTQMIGLQLSDTFEVVGHKYTMSTLTFEEEQWADSYTVNNCAMSGLEYIALRPVSVIAAAVKKIDDVPLEQLFEFPKDPSDALIPYTLNEFAKRTWYMNQLAYWFSSNTQGIGNSAQLVRELITCYGNLLGRRGESWDELKKASARMSGGVSKDLSSPEKVSSQVTQM